MRLGEVEQVPAVGDGTEILPPNPAATPSAWEQERQVASSKPGNLEYATAVLLVAALNKAGTNCDGWEAVPDPIGAQERGSCQVGTEEVTTAIFTTDAATQDEPRKKAELLAGITDVKTYIVYGVVTQFDAATGTDAFRANVAARNVSES